MSKYYRQGFKFGKIVKVGKKLSETLRKNMELTDPINIKKKDNIIDQLNKNLRKQRKKYGKKERTSEEPYNLDQYIDVIQSDFKTKSGPYFDRLRAKEKKLKGGKNDK